MLQTSGSVCVFETHGPVRTSMMWCSGTEVVSRDHNISIYVKPWKNYLRHLLSGHNYLSVLTFYLHYRLPRLPC